MKNVHTCDRDGCNCEVREHPAEEEAYFCSDECRRGEGCPHEGCPCNPETPNDAEERLTGEG